MPPGSVTPSPGTKGSVARALRPWHSPKVFYGTCHGRVRRSYLRNNGNIRQLCGFDKVGTDRKARLEASNWQRLENISWVRHDVTGKIVPLVGKPQHMHEAMQKCSTMARESLRKLVGGTLKVVDKWRKMLEAPGGIWNCAHGTSLVDFVADANPGLSA